MLWSHTVFVLVGCLTGAQGWETWNDEGNALRTAGHYREALQRYQRAFAGVPEQEKSAATEAMLLNNIATARLLLGDLSRAAEGFEASYQILERVQPKHPDNSLVLLNLATLWRG